MNRPSRLAYLLPLCLTLLPRPAAPVSPTSPAGGTPLIEYEKGMVRDAEVILIGTVARSQSRWNRDHTSIYTSTQLAVQEVLRGKGPVQIVEPGGTADGKRLELRDAGIPSFRPGERVLVFLRPGAMKLVGRVTEADPHYVMYAYHGKYRIDSTPAGEVAVAVHPETGEVRRRIPLSVLKSAIREVNASRSSRSLNKASTQVNPSK